MASYYYLIVFSGITIILFILNHIIFNRKIEKLSTLIITSGEVNCNNIISQNDALFALYAELKPKRGLPPTRGWAASPDLLRLPCDFIAENSPSTIVECSKYIGNNIMP